MDCQMPRMDGYAATGAVRRLEREKSRAASAIVALTANVLARDRTRCLEAGMNGFLPKPFTQEQLVAALKPVAESLGKLTLVEARPAPVPAPAPAAAASAPRPATPVAPSPVADDEEEMLLSDTVVMGLLQAEPEGQGADPALPVLDPEQIAAIRGLGKPQVLDRLCTLLYQTAPGSIERLQAALESGDLAAVAAVAHSLKSPVSSLGGRRLADQLDRCEGAARDRADLSAARDAAFGLSRAYADLEAALRAETARPTGT